MSGDFPGIHLNRRGTLRWLDNISKALPNLKLNERKQNTTSKFEPSRRKSFAEAVKNGKGRTPRETQRQTSMKKKNRGCYNCAEKNHTVAECRFSEKIRCHNCQKLGHKAVFCKVRSDFDPQKEYSTRWFQQRP